MFAVDDVAAEAIRRAYEDGGELAGVVELRKHFPLIGDNFDVLSFVRTIVSWKLIQAPPVRLSLGKRKKPSRS